MKKNEKKEEKPKLPEKKEEKGKKQVVFCGRNDGNHGKDVKPLKETKSALSSKRENRILFRTVTESPAESYFMIRNPSVNKLHASKSNQSFRSTNSAFNPNTLSMHEIQQIQEDLSHQREKPRDPRDIMKSKKDVGYHLLKGPSKSNFDISTKLSDREIRPRLLKKGLVKAESSFRPVGGDVLSLMRRQINKIHSKSSIQSETFNVSPRLFKTEDKRTKSIISTTENQLTSPGGI